MNKTCDDWGKLLLRITVGGLMLFHGIAKAQGDLSGMEGLLEGKGLPKELAYGIYVGEIVAPALLILGIFPRLAALTIAGTMGMALWLAHAHELLSLGDHGAWAIELPAFFLLTSLSIVFMGGGRFCVMGCGRDTPATLQ